MNAASSAIRMRGMSPPWRESRDRRRGSGSSSIPSYPKSRRLLPSAPGTLGSQVALLAGGQPDAHAAVPHPEPDRPPGAPAGILGGDVEALRPERRADGRDVPLADRGERRGAEDVGSAGDLPDRAPRTAPGPFEKPGEQGDRLIGVARSEEHTSELHSRENLVCRLLLE